MSLLPGAGALVLGGIISDLLFRNGRGIAGIVPNVIVQEQGDDELQITDHPVESGANITDHAFKKPATLSVTYGWSESGGSIPFAGLLTPTPADVYKMLLNLQNTCQPFDVITGKRKYTNMLLRRLSQATDQETENCLMVDAELQEIIVVDTTTTNRNVVIHNPESLGNQAANGPLTNSGTQQPKDVTAQFTDQQLIDAGVANATIDTIP